MAKGKVKEFTLHRYKIVSVLGRGAMGVVYRAYDPIIERPVAIKVLKRASHMKQHDYRDYLKRFYHEARLAGRLNHPAIVMIHDVGEWQNVPYIVMEYLEGTTLQSLLKQGHIFTWREAVRIVRDVALALDYAHQQGVIHRDIKPSNIMILDDGRVKVLDFGIARFQGDQEESGPYVVGTPSYVAPEIFQRQGALPQSDIFSLGVLFYQLLTGRKPFEGSKLASIIHAILYVTPPPVHEVNPAVPPICNTIVQKMLAKSPHHRYRSVAALARDLDRLLARETGPHPAPGSDTVEGSTQPMRMEGARTGLALVARRLGLPLPVVVGGLLIVGAGLTLALVVRTSHWWRSLTGLDATGVALLRSRELPHRDPVDLIASQAWPLAGPLTPELERTLHAQFQLGKNLCLNGSYRKCARIMESILRIQPDHREARRWLERARARLQGV